MTTTATSTTRITGYHLCGIDGKGRIVIRETRKTFAAGRKLADRCTLTDRGFFVTEFVATDRTAGDYGTVYFMDANGEIIDAPHNA